VFLTVKHGKDLNPQILFHREIFPPFDFITRENGLPELFNAGTTFAVWDTRQRMLCRVTLHGKGRSSLPCAFARQGIFFIFLPIFPSVFF
jgi:hypothetical protein